LVDVEVDDNATDQTLMLNEVKVKIEFTVNQLKGVLTQRIKA
jgi:hypothetical protein